MKISSARLLGFIGLRATLPAPSPECRNLPGDANWPEPYAWKTLNATVDGRLIANVPAGSLCHDPNYDAEACAALQASWTDPRVQ